MQYRNREDWFNQANCQGVDSNLFFPDLETKQFPDPARIIQYCKECSVADDCLDYCLSAKGEEEGYWGGTFSEQRRHLLKIREKSLFQNEWPDVLTRVVDDIVATSEVDVAACAMR